MEPDFVQIEWDARVEDDCRQLVRLAIREDLDREQDWTTVALVDHEAAGRAGIVARRDGVVAGLPAVRTVLEEMAPAVFFDAHVDDGASISAGAALATISGPARDLLTCERIALNFLGRLSGVATLARRYVDAVGDATARVYDTRKTTPGWRRLEKYATRCGGARNHRTGLFDAVLIKDNHLALGKVAGRSPADAVHAARHFLARLEPSLALPIEVEVDTLEQLDDVLAAAPDVILLDNMSPDTLREAVARRDAAADGRAVGHRAAGFRNVVELEASGGVNLDTIAAIAATGVDRISVGALTHSAPVLDVGLDWEGC